MTPAFLITLDAEGDNLWARAREVTTRNAVFWGRFQELAERHGFRPTWLVNWEMAHAPAAVELLRDALARGTAEVGMHLHAWNTPPLEPLTPDDTRHHPFLTEFPEPLMRAKIECLASALEEIFQTPVRSHRAGRWAFDGRYARLARARGVRTDCSVCPGVNWRSTRGDPRGPGGPDYRAAPAAPYLVDERDVTRPAAAGAAALLEVPMSTGAEMPRWRRAAAEIFSPRHSWLRPNGRNGTAMLEQVDRAADAGRAHAMFMLHSSELMPGGSPRFRDADAIERLYADTEAVFARARARGCAGRTLGEFGEQWRAGAAAG